MVNPRRNKVVQDRVRMNIWVKRSLYDGADEISEEDDVSLNDVVREALRQYITKRKSQGVNDE